MSKYYDINKVLKQKYYLYTPRSLRKNRLDIDSLADGKECAIIRRKEPGDIKLNGLDDDIHQDTINKANKMMEVLEND